MDEYFPIFKENIVKLINIAYTGTSNALAVADQLTFLWSVILLANDSPRPLKYPYKTRTSFTWAELLDSEQDLFDIQQNLLPKMLSNSSYVPKRMAGGGKKLTITPAQCHEILRILIDIYRQLDEMLPNDRYRYPDSILYDYMLEILFEGSIEGESEWMHSKEVDYIVSLASFHSGLGSNGESINVHDVHCRSAQLLTASYKELRPINPKTSLFAGRTLSPIMTRIATFRFLLSGIPRFSVLNKDPLIYPRDAFSVVARKGTDNGPEKYGVVYIYPLQSESFNSRKAVPDFQLLGMSSIARMHFAYLLYGLSICLPGGWLFAIQPEGLLEAEGDVMLDKIRHQAQIISVIQLPDDRKQTSSKEKSSIIVFRKEPLSVRQNLADIRRYLLSGFEDGQIKLFWDDYKQPINLSAISNMTGLVEVRRPEQSQPKLGELLVESIIKLENELLNSIDSRQVGEKLQDWQSTLYRFGTNLEISLEMQHLIRDNRIEAFVSEEGEVVFSLKKTNEKRTEYVPNKLTELLSREQWQLYLILCDSKTPLPIHKARQKLTREDQNRFTIQQAVDTAHMLSRMGLLEHIYESVDTGIGSTLASGTIDLWMKVPEGERQWKYTASH